MCDEAEVDECVDDVAAVNVNDELAGGETDGVWGGGVDETNGVCGP